jgi:ubiquinone/menaquinone biosynthesis C-methylase UbiE
VTVEYFNRMAATWDKVAAEKDQSRLERMARCLDIAPGSRVLDVGTGTGVFIPYLLKLVGGQGRLVCLDSSDRMLEKARAKNFRDDIQYLCADIARSSLEGEGFDAVVCYSSFPHFQDKPGSLLEINRLLKKGGRLFICHTSSRPFINGRHAGVDVLSHDLIPENDDMREMLSRAGFPEVRITDGPDSYLVRAVK